MSTYWVQVYTEGPGASLCTLTRYVSYLSHGGVRSIYFSSGLASGYIPGLCMDFVYKLLYNALHYTISVPH